MSEESSQGQTATEAAADSAEQTYAFCEVSGASSISPEHIRLVGVEGVKLGGGLRELTLCGRNLAGGWDIEGPVSDAIVARAMSRAGTVNPLCQRCAGLYQARQQH